MRDETQPFAPTSARQRPRPRPHPRTRPRTRKVVVKPDDDVCEWSSPSRKENHVTHIPFCHRMDVNVNQSPSQRYHHRRLTSHCHCLPIDSSQSTRRHLETHAHVHHIHLYCTVHLENHTLFSVRCAPHKHEHKHNAQIWYPPVLSRLPQKTPIWTPIATSVSVCNLTTINHHLHVYNVQPSSQAFPNKKKKKKVNEETKRVAVSQCLSVSESQCHSVVASQTILAQLLMQCRTTLFHTHMFLSHNGAPSHRSLSKHNIQSHPSYAAQRQLPYSIMLPHRRDETPSNPTALFWFP